MRDQAVHPIAHLSVQALCAFCITVCARTWCCLPFLFLKPHLTDAYGMQRCLDTFQGYGAENWMPKIHDGHKAAEWLF